MKIFFLENESEFLLIFNGAERSTQANIQNSSLIFRSIFGQKKSVLAQSALKHVYVRQLPLPNANYDAPLKLE